MSDNIEPTTPTPSSYQELGVVDSSHLWNWRDMEIDRNARAYGWEIGQGQEMLPVITFSPHNPFLMPDWRKNLKEPGDAQA